MSEESRVKRKINMKIPPDLIQVQQASRLGNGDMLSKVVPGVKTRKGVSGRSVWHILTGKYKTMRGEIMWQK